MAQIFPVIVTTTIRRMLILGSFTLLMVMTMAAWQRKQSWQEQRTFLCLRSKFIEFADVCHHVWSSFHGEIHTRWCPLIARAVVKQTLTSANVETQLSRFQTSCLHFYVLATMDCETGSSYVSGHCVQDLKPKNLTVISHTSSSHGCTITQSLRSSVYPQAAQQEAWFTDQHIERPQ